MLRESIKMFFSVAANEDFELRKMDIRSAFLQAKQLNKRSVLQAPRILRERDIYGI